MVPNVMRHDGAAAAAAAQVPCGPTWREPGGLCRSESSAPARQSLPRARHAHSHLLGQQAVGFQLNLSTKLTSTQTAQSASELDEPDPPFKGSRRPRQEDGCKLKARTAQ